MRRARSVRVHGDVRPGREGASGRDEQAILVREERPSFRLGRRGESRTELHSDVAPFRVRAAHRPGPPRPQLSREDWPGTHVPREAVLPVLSDWSTQLSRVLLMLLGPLPEFLTDADDAGRAALCQAAQRVLRVLAGDLAAPPRSPAGASVRSAFVARAAAPAARLTDRAALAAQSLVACAVENDVVSVAAAAAFAPGARCTMPCDATTQL